MNLSGMKAKITWSQQVHPTQTESSLAPLKNAMRMQCILLMGGIHVPVFCALTNHVVTVLHDFVVQTPLRVLAQSARSINCKRSTSTSKHCAGRPGRLLQRTTTQHHVLMCCCKQLASLDQRNTRVHNCCAQTGTPPE